MAHALMMKSSDAVPLQMLHRQPSCRANTLLLNPSTNQLRNHQHRNTRRQFNHL